MQVWVCDVVSLSLGDSVFQAGYVNEVDFIVTFHAPRVGSDGQPGQQLEELRFGRGDGLDDPPQSLRAGHVDELFLDVGGGHLQLFTICKQLILTFFLQALFQHRPIGAGSPRRG